MDKNHESNAHSSIDSASQSSAPLTRADQPHAMEPAAPHYLKGPGAAQSVPAKSVPAQAAATAGVPAQAALPDVDFDIPEYLPPKLRQRMQTLMAELSAIEEEESHSQTTDATPSSHSELLDSDDSDEAEEMCEPIPTADVVAWESIDELESVLPDSHLVELEPGDLVELGSDVTSESCPDENISDQAKLLTEVDASIVDVESSVAEEIDWNAVTTEELAGLGIQKVPVGASYQQSDTAEPELSVTEHEEESEELALPLAAGTIPFVEIFDDVKGTVSGQSADENPTAWVDQSDTTASGDDEGLTAAASLEVATPEDIATESTGEKEPEVLSAQETITLSTAKYLNPEMLNETPSSSADIDDELVDEEVEAVADPEEVMETTARFSEQAAEIVDILNRRQAELSYHRDQLELRRARSENEMRQQRLELVEKKRAFLEEVQSFRRQRTDALAAKAKASKAKQSVLRQPVEATAPAPEEFASAERNQPTNDASVAPTTTQPKVAEESTRRNVTLESIAMPVTNRGPVPTVETSSEYPTTEVSDFQPELEGADEDNLDPEFLAALEAHLRQQAAERSRQRAIADQLPHAAAEEAVAGSVQEGRLKQQAAALKKQHSAAVESLQKTRRQLELLRNVVVHQQRQSAERSVELDHQHREWTTNRDQQIQELEVDRQELARLSSIRENELSKRETAAIHREQALRQLEERLQEEQVEILRDRVVVRQLERTARQTLSNSQWSERLAIISQETETYLKAVEQKVDRLKSDASSQIKRMDSRQSELLLFRESTRNWVQRQMKLISRRAGYVEDREQQVNQRWQAVNEARDGLVQQQEILQALIKQGLLQIDQQLEAPVDLSSVSDAA